MRIVRVAQPLTYTACRQWSKLPVTTPESGPDNATVDHYCAMIPVAPGPHAVAAFERLRQQLLAYDIFPSRFMQSLICPSGPITDGATIIQRLVVGSVALEMAVRVIAVWDTDDGRVREAGFCYATIEGHAERGVERFMVRHDADGRVTVVLEARSRPGTRLTAIGRPLARLIQRGMTRAALRRLRDAGDPDPGDTARFR